MDAKKSMNSHAIVSEVLVRELILKLALKGHERVLHIGSADGTVTAAIAACLPRGKVLGIDSFPFMQEKAEVGYPENRYHNIRFSVADTLHLTYEGDYDIVFSHNLMNWITDRAPVYAGIYRALTPGGRFLIQMEGRGHSGAVIERIRALLTGARWAEFFEGFVLPKFPTEETEMQLCEGAGLYTVRVDLIEKTIIIPTPASLERWIRNIWYPALARVPHDQRDQCVSALLGEYQALYPPASDGSITFQVSRLEIEGRKESAA
jgi:trans-aconitate methyltransferase